MTLDLSLTFSSVILKSGTEHKKKKTSPETSICTACIILSAQSKNVYMQENRELERKSDAVK